MVSLVTSGQEWNILFPSNDLLLSNVLSCTCVYVCTILHSRRNHCRLLSKVEVKRPHAAMAEKPKNARRLGIFLRCFLWSVGVLLHWLRVPSQMLWDIKDVVGTDAWWSGRRLETKKLEISSKRTSVDRNGLCFVCNTFTVALCCVCVYRKAAQFTAKRFNIATMFGRNETKVRPYVWD